MSEKMSEIKRFFYNDRLNKGYDKASINTHKDVEFGKYQSALPPIEILAQYEEVSPGVFKKICDMAQREQSHAHQLDKLAIAKHSKAMFAGQVSAVIITIIVSISTLLLAIAGSVTLAGILAIAAFSTIALSSYGYLRTKRHEKPKQRFPLQNNKYKNTKSKRYKIKNYRR